MKLFLFLSSFLICLAVGDHTGTYSYSIASPDGMTYKGDIVLSMADGEYSGEIQSEAGSMPLSDLEIEEEEINFYITFQGYKVSFDGVFEDGGITATASVEGMEFPFKATKQ